MTFDSFVKRYVGKAVDYDGVSGRAMCRPCEAVSYIMYSAYAQVRGEMQGITGLILTHIKL